MRVETIGDATLYCADCYDVLPVLSGIDAIVTDPPYFRTDIAFDKNPNFRFVTDLISTIKQNGYLCTFGTLNIGSEIIKYWKLRFQGCWLKPNGVMRTHSARLPMGQQEPYYVFCKHGIKPSELTWNKVKLYGMDPYKSILRNNGYKRGGKDSLSRASPGAFTKDGYISENDGFRYATDVLYGQKKNGMPHDERTDHPTQKPVNVFEILVQWMTNSRGIVLDPFMGSGTTGVACMQTGRRFIGIEKDPKYFEIALKRVEKAHKEKGFL